MTLWWQGKHSKPISEFKLLPLNLCVKWTSLEDSDLPTAEPAFVESSITPQPTPASTRMYSMLVESVTDTEKIL